MTTKTVTVSAINCGHCTNTIEMEISELGGVTNVSADKDSKQVTIEWDAPANWETISEHTTHLLRPSCSWLRHAASNSCHWEGADCR